MASARDVISTTLYVYRKVVGVVSGGALFRLVLFLEVFSIALEYQRTYARFLPCFRIVCSSVWQVAPPAEELQAEDERLRATEVQKRLEQEAAEERARVDADLEQARIARIIAEAEKRASATALARAEAERRQQEQAERRRVEEQAIAEARQAYYEAERVRQAAQAEEQERLQAELEEAQRLRATAEAEKAAAAAQLAVTAKLNAGLQMEKKKKADRAARDLGFEEDLKMAEVAGLEATEKLQQAAREVGARRLDYAKALVAQAEDIWWRVTLCVRNDWWVILKVWGIMRGMVGRESLDEDIGAAQGSRKKAKHRSCMYVSTPNFQIVLYFAFLCTERGDALVPGT